MARPIVFSIAIIIMVFLPLFTLTGIEGKMFSPMAFTIAFALFGSLLAALFIGPALACYLLRSGQQGTSRLLARIQRASSGGESSGEPSLNPVHVHAQSLGTLIELFMNTTMVCLLADKTANLS